MNYFKAWNSHKIEKLALLISPNIILTDWEIKVSGENQFLQQNQIIFDSNPGIIADVKSIFEKKNEVIAVLEISTTNSNDIHHVVDHLKFEDSKIISITAYRGF